MAKKKAVADLPKNMVFVEWFDSCGPAENLTFTKEDLDTLEPMVMGEIGVLVKEEKSYIVIASNVSEQGTCRRLICIPRVNVMRIVDLEAKSVRPRKSS